MSFTATSKIRNHTIELTWNPQICLLNFSLLVGGFQWCAVKNLIGISDLSQHATKRDLEVPPSHWCRIQKDTGGPNYIGFPSVLGNDLGPSQSGSNGFKNHAGFGNNCKVCTVYKKI